MTRIVEVYVSCEFRGGLLDLLLIFLCALEFSLQVIAATIVSCADSFSRDDMSIVDALFEYMLFLFTWFVRWSCQWFNTFQISSSESSESASGLADGGSSILTLLVILTVGSFFTTMSTSSSSSFRIWSYLFIRDTKNSHSVFIR